MISKKINLSAKDSAQEQISLTELCLQILNINLMLYEEIESTKMTWWEMAGLSDNRKCVLFEMFSKFKTRHVWGTYWHQCFKPWISGFISEIMGGNWQTSLYVYDLNVNEISQGQTDTLNMQGKKMILLLILFKLSVTRSKYTTKKRLMVLRQSVTGQLQDKNIMAEPHERANLLTSRRQKAERRIVPGKKY